MLIRLPTLALLPCCVGSIAILQARSRREFEAALRRHDGERRVVRIRPSRIAINTDLAAGTQSISWSQNERRAAIKLVLGGRTAGLPRTGEPGACLPPALRCVRAGTALQAMP